MKTLTALERIEQVTLPAYASLSTHDQVVVEEHQKYYDQVRNHLMKALDSFEQRLEKVTFPSRVVQAIQRDRRSIREGKAFFEVKAHPERTRYYALLYDVAEDIAKVNNKLLYLNERFTAQIAQHLNEQYNLSLEPKDYGTAPITGEAVVNDYLAQTGGRSWQEKGIYNMKLAFSETVSRPVKVRNAVLQLDSYLSLEIDFSDRLRLEYAEDEKVKTLFRALSYFENNNYQEIHPCFSKFPGPERNAEVMLSEYGIDALDTVSGLRYYKNGRLDVRFASRDQALAFVTLFNLPV